MSLFNCSGSRPGNLGVTNGKLAPCPKSPNCVSTQTESASHRVDPIAYTLPLKDARMKIKQAITSMKGSAIIQEKDDYVYAEFTSALMGFVDDLEVYFSEADKLIHLRSASRLGYRDFGVNRQRVEALRQAFNSSL